MSDCYLSGGSWCPPNTDWSYYMIENLSLHKATTRLERPSRFRSRTTKLLFSAFFLLLTTVATTVTSAGNAYADDASSNPIVTLISTKSGLGYWQVASDGAVYSYGDARYFGGANNIRLRQPVVSGVRHPSGNGYWLVGADGGIFAYGDARFFGSAADIRLNQPIVGMAATPTGNGYWLVAADGGIFSYGDARFYGSAGDIRLNQPVVGMAATPTGNGYWLVAADGGIFSYGDARFYGSAGSIRLNQPVVGIVSSPSGNGYLLVAADGGIFAYGDAQFYGSTGGIRLNQPVVAMAGTPTGNGYWLVALDGGVFAYGDARFYGRAAYTPPPKTGYSYILPRNAAKSSLSAPHHDYPALDISVASGTPFYAITGGKVTRVDQPSGCGLGYILQGNDGAQYTYCHASKYGAASGTTVTPGQQLGLTGNTGSSTGPHLHIQIRYSGLRCPQSLVTAIYNSTPVPAIGSLPTGGCIS